MWRSKFLAVLFFSSLVLAACGKEPPPPTVTPAPTATVTSEPTETPVAPPTATASLPPVVVSECFGTLRGTDLNIPLCTEDRKQQIVLNPTQCLTVDTSIPVKIFFVNPPDWTLVYSVGTVDKAPGEELCNGADFVVTTEIWAEPIDSVPAAEIVPSIQVCDQQTNGAYIVVNEVESPVDGWVVIYLADSTEEIIARRSVKMGRTDSLQFIFTDRYFPEGAEFQALLHADLGIPGKFESDLDVALTEAQKFLLTIGDGELCVVE